jgi:hypothetical protein
VDWACVAHLTLIRNTYWLSSSWAISIADLSGMLPTKFRFIYPSGFRKEDLLGINKSETRMTCGVHVSYLIGTKWAIFIEDLPMMFPTRFGFIWQSGFRGEDCLTSHSKKLRWWQVKFKSKLSLRICFVRIHLRFNVLISTVITVSSSSIITSFLLYSSTFQYFVHVLIYRIYNGVHYEVFLTPNFKSYLGTLGSS